MVRMRWVTTMGDGWASGEDSDLVGPPLNLVIYMHLRIFANTSNTLITIFEYMDCMITYGTLKKFRFLLRNILLWSCDLTEVNFIHSPNKSRPSPSRRNQSTVNVDVIGPFWCCMNTPSSFLLSRFLDSWITPRRVVSFVQMSLSSRISCPHILLWTTWVHAVCLVVLIPFLVLEVSDH